MSEAMKNDIPEINFEKRAEQILSNEPILAAKDVEVQFKLRGQKLTAIRKCSLELYDGETLAIVGESGSGKSVFTKCFVGMLDKNGSITHGSIMYQGQDLTKFTTEREWRTIRGVAARNPKQKWREFQNNGICSKYTKSGPGRSAPGPLSYVLSSIPSRCAAALAIVMCASIPTASKPSSAAAASVVPLPANGSRILPPGTHICTT